MAGAAWAQQALLNTPGAYIGQPQLAVLQAAALRQCGEGGYIPDPMSCKFDPVIAQCQANQDPSSCLNPQQVAAARAIYAGPRTSDGRSLFPGYVPGAEAEPGSWRLWLTGASQDRASGALMFQFSDGFFRYMAFEDPAYDFLKLKFGGEFQSAKARTGATVDAVSPDLRAFRAHGGKLIQYHGWNDPAIPALSSVVYYEDVRAGMGEVSDFYRLFMVPGMLHCGDGPGPGSVDWLATLDAWVVKGAVPDQLTATNAPSPFALPPAAPASPRSQLLCPYPQLAGRAQTPDGAGVLRCIAVSSAPPDPKPSPPRRPRPRPRR